MSDARQSILQKIRTSLGRPAPDGDKVLREAADLIAVPEMTQPKFEAQTNQARFIERATSERLTATVDAVETIQNAPDAVQRYLLRANLPMHIAVPPMPRLHELNWGAVTLGDTLGANEPVVVNIADYAIAETGSLVFASRDESPTLYNYLPLHHVILVEAKTVLRYTEDYWQIVRAAGGHHPRNINFVTGTSGTADIEAKNVRGAHGPRFMHIVLFAD